MSETLDPFDFGFNPEEHFFIREVPARFDPDRIAPEVEPVRTYISKEAEVSNIPGGTEIVYNIDGSGIEYIKIYPQMDSKTLRILERNFSQLSPAERKQFREDFDEALPQILIVPSQQIISFYVENERFLSWKPTQGVVIDQESLDEKGIDSANNFLSGKENQQTYDGEKKFFFRLREKEPYTSVVDDDSIEKSVFYVCSVEFESANFTEIMAKIRSLHENGILTDANIRGLLSPSFAIELEIDSDEESGGEAVPIEIKPKPDMDQNLTLEQDENDYEIFLTHDVPSMIGPYSNN